MNQEAVRSGPRVRSGLEAGAAALAVGPVGMIVLTVLAERRKFAPSEQYLSFLVGDVLLAAAVATGFAVPADRPWPRWAYLIPIIAGLSFGAWQLQQEISAGIYTVGQSYSPTKLWHQFVIYPALGALLTRAIGRARGRPRPMAVIVTLTAVWIVLNLWDQHHPKHPHCDFSWSSWTQGCQ